MIIDFTNADGTRCRKVLNDHLPVHGVKQGLEHLDAAVLGTVAIQRAARLALLGHRNDARELLLATRHQMAALAEDAQKVELLPKLLHASKLTLCPGGVLQLYL